MDLDTQSKWDRTARFFNLMAGKGAEVRWGPEKEALFKNMDGKILFLALGTGLDIPTFPPGKSIVAIDISPRMLEQAHPLIEAYDGAIDAQVMDVHDMSYPDNTFDQVYTSCTFCSVPNPVAGLESLKRVLKPGGELFMFEHTGSRYYPFKIMMNLMTLLFEKIGPAMNRNTVANVEMAGFEVTEVRNIFLDVVKTIKARKPA